MHTIKCNANCQGHTPTPLGLDKVVAAMQTEVSTGEGEMGEDEHLEGWWRKRG